MRSFLRLLLPAALGAASVWGFAPYNHYWLPVLTLAWLFARLGHVGPRTAFTQGLAFGMGFFLAGVSWVYVSQHDFGQMPMPLAGMATVLFCGYLSLFPALATALATRVATQRTWRLTLGLPAAWVLLEWLRGWALTGFPWLAIGYAQAPESPLAGFAPLVGIYGVSGLVAFSAGLLALKKRGAFLLLAAIWLAGWGLQSIRWTEPVGAPITVSLIQGNIPQSMKFEPGRVSSTLIDYLNLTRIAHGQLVVLPETAFPFFWHKISDDYRTALAQTVRARGGDMLIGVPEAASDGRYFNSVVSLGTAPEQWFRKVHLVPFGEFVPPGFGWIVKQMHIPLGDFARGTANQPSFNVTGQRVAANICYEDVFGEEQIHVLPDATLMANVSNDAWFGDSAAPWQHLQIAQMRALETGRVWIRANNTGITAVLDERGKVLAQLPPFTRSVLETEAQGRAGMTPFARFGNVPTVLMAIFALVTAAWQSRRR